MKSSEYQSRAEQVVLHTYNRFPVVLDHGKGKKVIIFKYKPKKNSRTKNGHRQPFTKVEILSIG